MKFSRQFNRAAAIRGFSVLEMLVAVAVLATVTAVSWPFADGLRRFYQSSQTKAKMADYRGAWDAWLSANMVAVTASEWSGTAAIPAGVVDLGNGFSTLGSPPELAAAIRDGFSADMRVLLSPVRSKQWSQGLLAYYRDVYIVSGGNDGVITSGFATDATSGALTFRLAADDLVEVIYGEKAVEVFLTGAYGKLEATGDAIQRYYLARRNGDPASDDRRNYFHACPLWPRSAQPYCDPSELGAWTVVDNWYLLSPDEPVVPGHSRRVDILGLRPSDLRFGDSVGISISTGHNNSAFARAGPWFQAPFSAALRMSAPATSVCRGVFVQGALCKDVYAPL